MNFDAFRDLFSYISNLFIFLDQQYSTNYGGDQSQYGGQQQQQGYYGGSMFIPSAPQGKI
jgi:hypothetical protein